MKKGITFYIDDDVDMIAFCGTLCTQVKDRDIRGVTMVNFSGDAISECSEWYVPVKGKAEPYQSEIPTRWIPVSERLPDEYKRVLVSDSWSGVYVGQYIDAEESWGGKHFINEGGMHSKTVKAWQPLPEPYKASPTGAESEE